MHQRNPYLKTPINFADLASEYPKLKPHVFTDKDGKPGIDFKNVQSQRLLTEALLYRDFGLRLILPEGRLCPPIPNRLNYILWIQDVIDATRAQYPSPQGVIRGIDIGTGASAIYPLLACQMRKHWLMVGTEIDEISSESAELNIKSNSMADRIRVQRSSQKMGIFDFVRSSTTEYDFTMCNPPFYSSAEDMARSAESKDFDPHAVCTGADVEMITEGGEVGFVRRMISESMSLKTRCRWFSSMLGKLSSVVEMVNYLREHHIDNYGVTQFVQGKTRRWAIVWSFTDVRLPDSIGRIFRSSIPNSMPLPNTLSQAYPVINVNKLAEALKYVLDSIDLVTYRDPLTFSDPEAKSPVNGYGDMEVDAGATISRTPTLPLLTIKAASLSWSRAARRHKNREGVKAQSPSQPLEPILECEIRCLPGVVECRWTRGWKRDVFESFWSHVGRKLSERLAAKL